MYQGKKENAYLANKAPKASDVVPTPYGLTNLLGSLCYATSATLAVYELKFFVRLPGLATVAYSQVA